MADSGKDGGRKDKPGSFLDMFMPEVLEKVAKKKGSVKPKPSPKSKAPAKSSTSQISSDTPKSSKSDSASVSTKRKASRSAEREVLSVGGSPPKRKLTLTDPVVDLSSPPPPPPLPKGQAVAAPAVAAAPSLNKQQLADIAAMVAAMMAAQAVPQRVPQASALDPRLAVCDVSTGFPIGPPDEAGIEPSSAVGGVATTRAASQQSVQGAPSGLPDDAGFEPRSADGFAPVAPTVTSRSSMVDGTARHPPGSGGRALAGSSSAVRDWSGFCTATRTALPSGSGLTSRSGLPHGIPSSGLPYGDTVSGSQSVFADTRVTASGFPDCGLPYAESLTALPVDEGLQRERIDVTVFPEERVARNTVATGYGVGETVYDGQGSSLPPPVLRRAGLRNETVSGLSSEEEQEDARPASEGAIMVRALETVSRLQPDYVCSKPVLRKPGFCSVTAEDHLQFRTHPVVSSWFQFHWNQMRSLPSLGIDTWTPEAVPLADWPRPAVTLAAPKLSRSWSSEDPQLPGPALPTDSELAALLKPEQAAKFSPLLVTTKVLPNLEGHLHAAMESLSAVGSLTSALNVSLRDESNPSKLSSEPVAEDILSLLDSMPVALSALSKGLTAARVVSTVARRDGLLAMAHAPKSTTDKLRVAPPVKGAMFGPFLKMAQETVPAAASLTVDDFALAMSRAFPAGQKAKGWGSARQPQQKGKGKRNPRPSYRGRPRSRQGKKAQGGSSHKKNPPNPPSAGN